MGKKSPARAPRPLPPEAGFTPAEIAAMTAARGQAEAGTPAVVREALLGGAIQVGAVTLPEIMLGHVLLLQKIGSPLATDAGREPTNDEVAQALFTLNTPLRTVLDLLAAGRAAFDEAALIFALEKIPLRDLRAIGTALGTQLARAHATVVGGHPSPASSGGHGAAAAGQKKSLPPAVPASPGAAVSPPSPTG